jgi:ATP-dependent protease HslVU (ClpYQ) peptidase subunit
MTTIAFRDGVLAGDGRITTGDMIDTNSHRKVHRLRDGRLMGWAGGVEDGERMRRALNKDQEPPKDLDLTCLLIERDGSVHLWEKAIFVKQKDTYFAIGSGAGYALGAMDAGASAAQAVAIGIKRDTSSGGKVKTVELKDKT